MGLSLHYEVRFAARDRTQARAQVRTLRQRACEFARTKQIDKVLPISSGHQDLGRFAARWIDLPDPEDPHTVHGVAVSPLEGWIFPVLPGEGCEPLWFGLCRYPASVRHEGRDLATKCGRGWSFQAGCKTQYASQHGWEHFRRCHTSAIRLIRGWVELGGKLRLWDEGGWWPRRSDAALRRKLDEMNGLVAAFAGAMKDAAEAGGPTIESPIFEHPHFERLEAEGVAKHGEKIATATKLAADELRRRGTDPAPS